MTDDGDFDLEVEFPAEEVHKISSLACIQEIIVDSMPSNALETNVRLSELVSHDDPSLIPDLIHMFFVAAKYRHQNIPILADVLRFLIDKSTVPNALALYRQHLFPSFTKTNSRLGFRHRFTCECIRKRIADAVHIVGLVRQFRDAHLCLSPEIDTLAAWYSPYVIEHAPELARDLHVIADPDLYATLTEYAHPRDTVEYCLRTDDVVGFQRLIVSHPLPLDRVVAKSAFETGYLLENEPYFVHYAVYYGAVRCVKFMLLNNVDLAKHDRNMVFVPQFAAAGGDCEIIRLLEQRRCYFNGTQQISALFHRNSVFDWLNATKYPVTDYNDPYLGSTIIQAVIANNLSIFLLLLARSKFENLSDVLCKDLTIYRSVLQAAAEYGHTALVRFLLSRPGLDINAQNQGNNTALHFACYYGHFETVRVLLDYPGIDLSVKNRVQLFIDNVLFAVRPFILCE
jgi:ankyrin repeat protein